LRGLKRLIERVAERPFFNQRSEGRIPDEGLGAAQQRPA
jgi:hypothetical protein